MPIPVPTQILDLVEPRLKNMTVLNEYSVDLGKIERARLEPFKNGDFPALNYYVTGDILVKNINTAIEERTISLVIEYYDLTRDKIFLDLSNELAADVKIALERDASAPKVSDLVSHLLGKKVMKLEFDTITPAIGQGQNPYCGVVMVISITYRVDRHDPFTLIDF